LVRTPASKSDIFVCAIEGISSLTNALNAGASALPEAAPANTWFVVLVVALSKNAPLPPIGTIDVEDPPAPPVPLPITKTSSPSLKATSAFSNYPGFDDPVDLFILIVLATRSFLRLRVLVW